MQEWNLPEVMGLKDLNSWFHYAQALVKGSVRSASPIRTVIIKFSRRFSGLCWRSSAADG